MMKILYITLGVSIILGDIICVVIGVTNPFILIISDLLAILIGRIAIRFAEAVVDIGGKL
jgi:hypothetical protein